MSDLVVTGAAGFLGRAIVAAARAEGVPVRALVRSDPPRGWQEDTGITAIRGDLVDAPTLSAHVEGATAVIHAAAGAGDDAAHARDTIAATEALLAALPDGARLVLVSSFSVYNMAALPVGATLDEKAPLESDAARRDAYTRAKLAQERVALAAAKAARFDLRIARPGVIYGPGHGWTSWLGWTAGGRVICPGGDTPIPAIHVADCATALVRLTLADGADWPGDLPAGEGRAHVVNFVAPNPPVQRDWLAALGLKPVILPYDALMGGARVLHGLARRLGPLDRALPNGLRPAKLAARFKPLRYDTSRAETRLGPLPHRDALATLRADRTAS